MFFNQNANMMPPMNPMMNLLSNRIPGFNNAYMNAMQLIQQSNQSPEQIVRGLLQNGQISQDQFNQASMIANMLTGRKL